ncbi:MAG: tolC 1 [Firmicutes bacterium]|nr:tolC 1 [Bacillota bacterium]
MKQYRRACIGLFLSVSLLTLGTNAQAEAALLTLPESIDLALKNNPTIQIAQANIEKAHWGLEQARANNGVTLEYNYLYGRSDQPPSWYNNTTTNFEYPAWSDTYTFYSHQLKLQLPLYTGGKLESTADMANRGKIAMGLALTSTKEQLTLEVTTSYYNVLQARNLSVVAQQAVDDLSAHLNNVQYHYDAGTVALSDVLQTQVRLADARNNLIKAQNAAKMARYNLNKVIGLSLTDDTNLDDHISFEPYTGTLEDSLAIAFKNRAEIQQAKLQVAMSEDKIKIAQSNNLPTVAAIATENIADSIPANSKHNTDWAVAISVSFNVFDNGITKTKTKDALAELTIAAQQKRQLEDAITLEVSNTYLSVQEAAERIKNNQVAVNQSKRDYEMAQERYNSGIGTNLDVMDAEVAMTQAKTNYIQALYDYNSSRSQLNKAMGLLH